MAYILGTPGTNKADILKGGAEDDTLIGYGGDDSLWGLGGNDQINGGSGNDWLSGDDGDDTIYGGAGIDSLYGGEGDDVLYGNAGEDFLDGGDGNDRLEGGAEADTIRGGAGDDTVVGFTAGDDIDGGEGYDTLDLSGLGGAGTHGVYVDLATSGRIYDYGTSSSGDVAGVEKIIGTDRIDIVFQGATNDWFDGGAGNDHWSGGAGADYFWGGDGTDTALYTSATSGVRVALQSFNASGTGDAAGDVLLQVENLTGSSHADHLTGDSQNNVIRGGGGRDVIVARTGSDTLTGGGGADTFVFDKSYTVQHGRSSQTYVDRGNDVVTDYVDDVDLIELRGYRASEVSIVDSGADAIINAGWSVDIRVEGAAGLLDMGDLVLA